MLLTAIIFMVLPFCSFAQEYDLNQYQYRFQKYQYAESEFNLVGNGSITVAKSDYLNGASARDNDLRGFNSGGSITHGRLVNTQKLQLERNASFNTNGGWQHSGSSFESTGQNKYISTSKNRNFLFDFSSNQSMRFYNENNNFNLLIIGLDGFHSNFKKRNSGSNSTVQKNNVNEITNRLGLGRGFGRLEYVSDAVTAQFILQDLKQKAGDNSELSNEQIESLARGVTTTRNTRFLDRRFRLIDQIEMLDSFVQLSGVKSSNSLRYYTSLYDNWLYATKLNRTSGKRLSIYALTETKLSKSIRSNENSPTNRDESKGRISNNLTSLNIDYIISKQLNFQNQRSFKATAFTTLSHSTNYNKYEIINSPNPVSSTETKTKLDDLSYNINLEFEHLYQPNSRTFLIFSFKEE